MSKKKMWDWQAGLVGINRRREEPFPNLSLIQAQHIDKILNAYGFNFVHAAKALGISRATLYRKVNRYLGPLRRLDQKRKRLRSQAD